MNIRIVNYGAGNIASVANAIYTAGYDAEIASTPEEIIGADKVILPGVGAAGQAIKHLRKLGLDDALTQTVRERGRPMLGICLGMQMIATTLHEYGEHKGLGWIEGDVVDLHGVEGITTRIPHMGWNSVSYTDNASNILADRLASPMFYFSHSFTLRTANTKDIVSTTNAGAPVIAAIQNETVFATQFHPEKSQINGEKLISAFMKWNP